MRLQAIYADLVCELRTARISRLPPYKTPKHFHPIIEDVEGSKNALPAAKKASLIDVTNEDLEGLLFIEGLVELDEMPIKNKGIYKLIKALVQTQLKIHEEACDKKTHLIKGLVYLAQAELHMAQFLHGEKTNPDTRH